jgi:hypothetical protein
MPEKLSDRKNNKGKKGKGRQSGNTKHLDKQRGYEMIKGQMVVQ